MILKVHTLRKWGARGEELYLRATKVTAVKVMIVCVCCCCCKCCFGRLFAAGAIGVVVALLSGVRRAGCKVAAALLCVSGHA